jgi:hypothetical protein
LDLVHLRMNQCLRILHTNWWAMRLRINKRLYVDLLRRSSAVILFVR